MLADVDRQAEPPDAAFAMDLTASCGGGAALAPSTDASDSELSNGLPAAGQAPAAAVSSQNVERLQRVFGQKSPNAGRNGKRRAHVPAFVQPVEAAGTPAPLTAPPPICVPPERFLDLAHVEAVQGRSRAARALLSAVEAPLDTNGVAGWDKDDMRDLAEVLLPHALLHRRLTTLLDDLLSGAPQPPAISAGTPQPLGRLWPGHDVGPAYSLLLRMPDVLDRAHGDYLSELIGEEQATEVHSASYAADRTEVASASRETGQWCRDATAWFVVGSMRADEWFPPHSASSREGSSA